MKAIALVRLAAAAAIFGSIVWQISDRLANNLFRPGEYFAYFTIDSSLIAAVALAVSGVWAWLGRDETGLLHLVRLSVVTSATIVAVVYNALLRGMANLPADGDYVWPVFSLIRGLISGWWPYWFIDPTGDGGVGGMLTYIGGIMAFFVAVGLAATLGRKLVAKGL